ncbi:MAG: hypothetical protein C5B43_04450 [Verrucomicrobia bacterium]|nr:MAG: hypothetical protein C5B43_04450 [Verrucomicrobiota bacterium]
MDLITYNTVPTFWVSTILYGIAFLYALTRFLKSDAYSNTAFYLLLSCAFIIQGMALYYRGMLLGSFPLTNTLEIFQFISWSTIFLIIIFQIAFKLPLLSFFGTGFVTILNIFSLTFYKLNSYLSEPKSLINPWIEFHAALAIFAYAVFGLLAITSLMYLFQDYGLSHKHFGRFYTLLPSLKKISEISKRILLIGVVSLAVAIMIGTLIWFEEKSMISIGKILSTYGLLICYLTLYFLKRKKLLKLRTFSWISIALFLMAVFSLWPIQYK